MKNLKIIIGIIVVIIIIFLLAKGGYKKSEDKAESANTTQSGILEIKLDDWVTGNPNAKVTLVEYLDFECEACAAYYPITTQLKEEYKDNLRFVVRYFPLPGHANSVTAAKAVEAAGRQGKFWEMYSTLYENQKEWGEQKVANQEQFEKYAVAVGLDIEQWKNDLKDPALEDRIQRSYKEAVKLGLQGTPSFFLDGKKIESPKGYAPFKVLIEDAMK